VTSTVVVVVLRLYFILSFLYFCLFYFFLLEVSKNILKHIDVTIVASQTTCRTCSAVSYVIFHLYSPSSYLHSHLKLTMLLPLPCSGAHLLAADVGF